MQSVQRGSEAASEQPGGRGGGGEAVIREGLTMTRVPEDPDVLEGKSGLRQAARRQT